MTHHNKFRVNTDVDSFKVRYTCYHTRIPIGFLNHKVILHAPKFKPVNLSNLLKTPTNQRCKEDFGYIDYAESEFDLLEIDIPIEANRSGRVGEGVYRFSDSFKTITGEMFSGIKKLCPSSGNYILLVRDNHLGFFKSCNFRTTLIHKSITNPWVLKIV